MNFIQMPSDFMINKLIFLKESSYSLATKKAYWNQYLLFIADLEENYKKDLYEFDDKVIKEYEKTIVQKSDTTIRQTNSFINKYTEWYSNYYKVEKKVFKFNIKKEKNNSWYINKEDFFKMCNVMLGKTTIQNISPLIFARYGFMGKESFYMRNVKWHDIDFENKEVLIRNEDRKIISYIPVDDEFLKWMKMLKESDEEKYKGKEIINKFVLRSQIKIDQILDYSTLNSRVYKSFKEANLTRISLTILNNCAIVDYIDSMYKTKKLQNNQELIDKLSIFSPEEIFDRAKLSKIKIFYLALTNNKNIVIHDRKAKKNSNNNIDLSSKLELLKIAEDSDLL